MSRERRNVIDYVARNGRPVPKAHYLALMIALIVLVVFGRIVANEFTLWDDPSTIHANPRLNPPTLAGTGWYWGHAEGDIYVPLTYTVWVALARVGYSASQAYEYGTHLNSMVFHAASVVAHALAALAVYALLRRLVRGDWAAAAGALIFALHPVQVEAVAWASGLKDVLCGLFAVTALWQYTLFAQGDEESSSRWNHYGLASLCFVASLLSKPSGVIVPALAAVIDLLIIGRPIRRVANALIPWLPLSLGFMVIARLVQPGYGIFAPPLWARPLVALDALAFYLLKLVLPVGLTVDYGRRPQDVLATGQAYFTWMAPVAVAGGLWMIRKRHATLVAAGLLFVSGVAPVLGLTPFLFQYYSTTADHYLYLAMLGPALAGAYLLSLGCQRYRFAAVAASGALAALAGTSIIQAGHWQSDLALWQHAVEVTPRSFNTHYSLAIAMRDKDANDPRVLEQFRKAAELNPDHAKSQEQLAQWYLMHGQVSEGIDATRRMLKAYEKVPERSRPDLAAGYENLGDFLVSQSRYAQAREAYTESLRIAPTRGSAATKLEQLRAVPGPATNSATRP